MSILPFYLRSQNGSGCIYVHVSNHRMSEICLFQDRASFEVWPLDIQKLVNKSSSFQLVETTAAIFEDALKQFFERSGAEPVKVVPLALPPTPQQVEQSKIVSESLNGVHTADNLPF